MPTQDELDRSLIEIKRRIKAIDDNMFALRGLVEGISASEVPKVKATDSHGEPRFEYLVVVPLPSDFYLTREMSDYALDYKTKRWTPLQVNAMFDEMRDYYDRVRTKKNGKWSHWRKVWYKWVRTTYDRETKGTETFSRPTRFNRAAIRE